MQLLLVRHALPLRSEPGPASQERADPELSDEGRAQVARLPDALARFPITRVISSPQLRAVQTAEPVAASRGLDIEIDDRFAEYDRELPVYIPIEQIRAENPQEWARMAKGHLPSAVDEDAFRARVQAAVDNVAATAEHEDTVAVFSHGGDQRGVARDSGDQTDLVVSDRLRVGDPAAVLPIGSGKRGDGQRHRARVGPAAAESPVVDRTRDS
jgi:probable phosphoglycerate mutase